MAETTLAPTQQQKDLSSVLSEIEKRKIAGTFTPSTIDNILISEANKTINSGQGADFKKASEVEEPEVRSSLDIYNSIYNQISTSLTKDLGTKPEKVDLTETYKALRGDSGITTLETSLTDLQAQARDIQAISAARTSAEKAKPVAMNVIAGRISEEEAQDNERLTAINNSIKTVTDQLNTKYNMIDTIMKYTGEDYSNAVDNYDKKLAQNLSIMNTVKGMTDDQISENDKAIDRATANAQILLNSYTKSGISWDAITPAEQTNLVKLGVQSGLGANFFSTLLKNSTGKEMFPGGFIVSPDKTEVSIMYTDGTTKKISTGLSKSSNLSPSEQKAEEIEANRQTIQADVGRITGEDRKVNPSEMYRLRQDIALNNPELLTWFDNAYKPADLLNPANYPRAVRENSWTVAIKEEKSANNK